MERSEATMESVVIPAQRVFREYGDATALYSFTYQGFISACVTPMESMTRADVRRLALLGWIWDDHLGCWTTKLERRDGRRP